MTFPEHHHIFTYKFLLTSGGEELGGCLINKPYCWNSRKLKCDQENGSVFKGVCVPHSGVFPPEGFGDGICRTGFSIKLLWMCWLCWNYWVQFLFSWFYAAYTIGRLHRYWWILSQGVGRLKNTSYWASVGIPAWRREIFTNIRARMLLL